MFDSQCPWWRTSIIESCSLLREGWPYCEHRCNKLWIPCNFNDLPLPFFSIMPMIIVIKLLADVGVRPKVLRLIRGVVFLCRKDVGKLLVVQRFPLENSSSFSTPWGCPCLWSSKELLLIEHHVCRTSLLFYARLLQVLLIFVLTSRSCVGGFGYYLMTMVESY